MDENKDTAKGRIKQAVGDLTGNRKITDDGKLDKATGEAKKMSSDAIDWAKNRLKHARARH